MTAIYSYYIAYGQLGAPQTSSLSIDLTSIPLDDYTRYM